MKIATAERCNSTNLRDLGGVMTTDGARVRSGMIYRSAMLDSADFSLIARLKSLGIATIVDLRTDSERARFPTPWQEIGCTDYQCSDDTASAGNLVQLLSSPASSPATIRAEMIALYRTLPFLHAQSYRVMFEKLAAARTPLLFHCAAGKDRTGVAAALVLAALNVPQMIILDDYLQTNAFDVRGVVWKRDTSVLPAFRNLPEKSLRPLFAADPAYIAATFQSLQEKFGTVERYLNRELRIGRKQLRQIRHHLLEPGSI